ncbi:HPr family phosphocarrier protein [Lachnobacterium bovis]|uniref:PTS HPr component phosphorylation site n=1 Tax=Lachnobacterium bovis TaxID=140626 RepID=A0A1H9TDE7_9FIRM|nr:HPr family phosphocarrier protein [Lachnobacterium bovis]SER95222.1 PTS HPr component phosphorylation site [Lachnobacterium bovis]
MYENKKMIRFADTNEVKEFVKAAGKCDFDIDVIYNRIVIDAKSILGVLALGINKDLTIGYHGNDENFESVLSDLSIA